MRVLAYVRVSSQEQSDSGAGLAAQRAAIEAEAIRRNWEIVSVIEDAGFSAKDLKRPGIKIALETLEAGKADAIVCAKLDRLSRSLLDFAGLMQTAQKQGWGLIALDAADTTTPAGEAMANVLATFAQFERRLIGQRTREALAQKRAQGIRLGRPREIDDKIVNRIVKERKSGKTLQAIADSLTADGIKTARDGNWYPGTIAATLKSAKLDRELARAT